MKIGDPVEFEMTYDRRTGKPIASTVSKIAPEVVLREERVIGTVTTEARIDPETGSETHGRISYENRGECFFLPFTMSDVEGNVTVAAGDKVSFQVKLCLYFTVCASNRVKSQPSLTVLSKLTRNSKEKNQAPSFSPSVY